MLCPNCHQDCISTSTEVCPHCNVYLPSVMREMLAIGTILRQGTYRIDGILGRGGFGVTYQAFHLKLAKNVAIKEYYPQDFASRNVKTGELTILTNYESAYKRSLERFIREGRILAKLHHQNIVRVHDLFEELGTAYLVMDLLSGRTLGQELNAQPGRKLSPQRIEEIMEPLVDGLDAVHKAGVFHLDLKPENIMLSSDGQVILLDFGAARLGVSNHSTQPFTEEYAAPEVIARHDVGAYSDIFELGMVLYEMLTGEPPAPALSRIMKDHWQPINLEEPWKSLVNKALQMSQFERPQTVREWWRKKPVTKPNVWGNIKTILPNPREEKEEKEEINASNPHNVEEENLSRYTPDDLPLSSSRGSGKSLEKGVIEKGVIVIGDRAIGKTSMVVTLAKGTKLVKVEDSGRNVIARYYNPSTGKIAGTDQMTPETLSVNVELPSGEKQIQFIWIDTPGEAFSSSQWRAKNESEWQDIQGTISHSRAVILLVPPYRELILQSRIDARTISDDLPNYKQWLHRLENWLDFIKHNCQKVEHILICLHRADTFCDVKLEAKKWRFDNYQGPFWSEYDKHIRNQYFKIAESIIKTYNSQNSATSLRFFITTIDELGLLELPWIYLASFLTSTENE